jgi:lipopolysaccharide transport system ATP-binding protein
LPTTSDRRLAIETRSLSKDYVLGELPDVIRLGMRGLQRVRGRAAAAPTSRVLPALKDVSFEVEVGECLGIMGSNGSGKSTLVQIISGITVPTGGEAHIRGRVLPLVEVGAVFHEELTARENVLLFGTVLGLTQDEIREAMPEISEFGGIDSWHMDTPLKRHSTGMHARLSFAVAMRFPADIYIFDEVMAVVDDQFRAMAVEEIRNLIAAGRTVVFISHDLDLVRALCTKGMWLEKGELRVLGDINEVADRYHEAQLSDT